MYNVKQVRNEEERELTNRMLGTIDRLLNCLGGGLVPRAPVYPGGVHELGGGAVGSMM